MALGYYGLDVKDEISTIISENWGESLNNVLLDDKIYILKEIIDFLDDEPFYPEGVTHLLNEITDVKEDLDLEDIRSLAKLFINNLFRGYHSFGQFSIKQTEFSDQIFEFTSDMTDVSNQMLFGLVRSLWVSDKISDMYSQTTNEICETIADKNPDVDTLVGLALMIADSL
ncbi:MAG: hypothetical protein AAF316_00300 [Cyanobacteria bacterium P01_A01_bin.80]